MRCFTSISSFTSEYDPFFDNEEGVVEDVVPSVLTRMRRPDLAATVRQLDIAIIPGTLGHTGRCWIYEDCSEDYGRCSLDELCENLLLTAEVWSILELCNLRWMMYIRPRPAVCCPLSL
jgi:hypothetical protein